MKKFRNILLGLALLVSTLTVGNFASAISVDCSDRQWFTKNNPGFSVRSCPNGVAFPVFNAFSDYNKLHFDLPGDERRFTRIRTELLANGTTPNFNAQPYFSFKEQINLNKGETANIYTYLHNNANPSNNRDGSSVAKNVKLKANNFTRDSDGFYYLTPAAGSNSVTLSTTIQSSNTTPPTRTHSLTVNLPPNSRLQFKSDATALIKRTPCHVNSPSNCQDGQPEYVPSIGLVNGSGLTLNNNNNGISGDFFGSQGYRMRVHYFVTVVDAPNQRVLACDGVKLLPPNSINYNTKTAEFIVAVKSNLTQAEALARLNQNLANTFTARPQANSLRFSALTINNPGNLPAGTFEYKFTVSDIDPNESFTVRLPGFTNSNSDCAQNYEFQPRQTANACKNFELKNRVSGQNTIFSIDNIDPATYRNAQNKVLWSLVRSGGAGANSQERDITQTYSVPTSSLTPGTRVIVRLSDLDKDGGGCNGSYTVPPIGQTACQSFNISPTTASPNTGTQQFRLTNILPAGFSDNVIWTRVNSEGQTVSTTTRSTSQSISFTNLSQGEVIKVALDQPNPPSGCTKQLTITDSTACESLTLSPNTFSTTGPTTFTASTTPNNSYNLVWAIRKTDGSTEEVGTRGSKTFTLQNPANITGVAVFEQIPTNNSPCRATATPSTTEENVCRELIVINSRGQRVNSKTKLPGSNLNSNRWESYTLRTEPSEFLNQVSARANNITVTKNGNTYYAFNALENPSLEFNGPNPACSLTLNGTQDNDDSGNEPEIKKYIHNNNETSFGPLNYRFSNVGEPINYTVEVTGLPSNIRIQDTELNDPISRGIAGKNNENNESSFGSLTLNSDINVSKDNNNNKFTYSYSGIINWPNRNDDCTGFTKDCSVNYENEASLRVEFPGQTIPTRGPNTFIVGPSNPTYAIVLCPFILSRGFGDVFTTQGFTSGVNVAACGARNTQSPVFTQAPATTPQIVATGGIDASAGASHSICQAANNIELRDELKDIFNADQLKNFSSATCQVAMINAERWQKNQVIQGIINTFNRIAPAPTSSPILSKIDTTTNFNRNRIASYNQLTLDNKGDDVTIEGSSARTIVVRGDININSNLKYQTNGTVAFVAIGGDIIFKPGVTKAEGIFVAIPNNDKGGSIKWADTDGVDEKPSAIEIKGSVFGDINPLLDGVTTGGDLSRDRGEVTVIFDGRITRKIPPGLQDVIKFNQFQTATGSNVFTDAE